MGKTTLMSSLSCDSVIAGAFSPQPDSHVPEEKMSQHAGQHMVSPPGKLPHFVMIHPQVRFGLLKALLDGPANPREPYERFQTGGSAGVRDEVGEIGLSSWSSANYQPNRPIGLSLFGQNNATLHKFIGYRSLCSFGDRPAIPEVVIRPPCDFLEGEGSLFGFRKYAFCPFFSTVPVGLFHDRRVMQPAESVAGKSHKVRHSGNHFHRIQKLRAVSINRIHRYISEGNHLCGDDFSPTSPPPTAASS